MNRRRFLGSATGLTASALAVANEAGPDPQSAPARVKPKKKRRTMYFNDARHFYLYSFEPPMSLEDAWRPVDELAGTAVNTLIYGVETAGLFSDTKVGIRAGSDQRPFTSAHAWRAWYNMQSLIDRGLDPLRVLVDRAHERGLEFITSMRMGGGPRDERYRIGTKGRTAGGGGALENNSDFAHREVMDLRFSWLEELAGYPVEGIELDFAFTPFYFKPHEVKAHTPLMTDYVRRIAKMVRSKGAGRIVGARVFPTVAMNLALGLDVGTWLSERLVDYVAPLYYGYFLLDPDLPFDSLTNAAHAAEAEVYPILQPYFLKQDTHATPAMLRAAIANYWAKGADGLIIAPWYRWPFRDEERSILTDIGEPDVVSARDKHYFVSTRLEEAAALGYSHPLPMRLDRAGPNLEKQVPFYIADNLNSDRVARVRLLIKVLNLVAADRLVFKLNGQSLVGEPLHRTSHRYEFYWFEFTLLKTRPQQGRNILTASLESRLEGFEGGVTLEQVEVLVEYNKPHSFYDRPPML